MNPEEAQGAGFPFGRSAPDEGICPTCAPVQQTSRVDDLEDFFENGAVGLHLVGPDGTILRANRAELEMLGYQREEYVGRNIREFHADAEVITEILGCLGRGETLDKYPARLKAKDGTVRHVLITSSVRFEDGKFVHTRCFTIDVTNQMRVEAALRGSEERLARLLELAPLGIAEIAQSGRILYANAAAERILRLTRAQIEGRRYDFPEWQVTTPAGVPIPREQTPPARALRGERISNEEVAVLSNDGYRVVISVSAMPLRDQTGPTAALVAFADVTARHDAENGAAGERGAVPDPCEQHLAARLDGQRGRLDLLV